MQGLCGELLIFPVIIQWPVLIALGAMPPKRLVDSLAVLTLPKEVVHGEVQPDRRAPAAVDLGERIVVDDDFHGVSFRVWIVWIVWIV